MIKKFLRFGIIVGAGSVLLRNFYFNGPSTPLKKRLDNKIIVVTGASDGIGRITAITLLEQGAHVVFATRNQEKTKKIIDAISDPNIRKNADMITLDLSSFKSVNNFAEEFEKKYNKLDILINNAGAYFDPYQETEDGIEATLQVNTLSPMILTEKLLKSLAKSDSSRIINVSSDAHHFYKVKNEEIQRKIDNNDYTFNPSKYSSFPAYAFSKYGNIAFTKNLDSYLRLKNLHIKTAALHPGVIFTELIRSDHPIYQYIRLILRPIAWVFCKDLQMGAQTTLHCVYLDDKDFSSGAFYQDCAEKSLKEQYTNPKSVNTHMNYFRNIINHYGAKTGTSFNLL
jgi:NAD(P)-dependent dehydrogenase (short-subunit alcohol dehydrogenase family)